MSYHITSLEDQNWQAVKRAILDPETSQLPEEQTAMICRITSLARIIDRHPQGKTAITLHMNKYPEISGSQATSIRRFQDRYGYPDEIWNFQSIKKDLDRNTIRQEIGFDTEIYDKIQKILMHNLYKLGTLSKNNQLSNEYSRKRTKQPRGDSQDLADRFSEDSHLSL